MGLFNSNAGKTLFITSTDKTSLFVDAKRVIGMQCKSHSKKGKK
jgi:hypothetical protein